MTSPYRFEDYVLDPATRELHDADGLVALPARAFDCLAYLIAHRDRAVGRDELIAAVWGRTEISDALLSHTILRIRRTLGDTGNEQRTIRTVPRFGYRWVGAPAPATAASAAALQGATRAPEAVDANPTAGASVSAPARPAPGATRRRAASLVLMLVAAAAIVFVALRVARRPPSRSPSAETATAGTPRPEAAAAPALVLPAEVSAPDDWRWLRLGLMDLVATRLRDGALPTVPSENVVGLLRQRGAASGDTLLHDRALARIAVLRVLPQVRLDANRWRVRLDAAGAQRSLSVEAEAADAIEAGRLAADRLLRKLGRTPGAATGEAQSPALEELLQRSGAAMLADQLDQARSLIGSAAPALQDQPRMQQRLAQIELRSGDYAGVETRLHALLDRLQPQRDAALRARALLTLAAAYVRQDLADQASELYDEAIALRRGQSDPEVLGVAHLGRAAVFAGQSRFDEAGEELSRARIELETVGDVLGIAAVDVNTGEFRLARHRPAEALPTLKNAALEFDRLGAREGLAHTLAQQAGAELEMLDADAALATSERFWPPEAHTSNLRMRWTLAAVRARVLAALGRSDAAEALVERISAESDPRKDEVARAQADALAAQIAWRRADAGGAAQHAAAALIPALRGADVALYTRTLLLHSGALRTQGRAADADKAVEALRAWATAEPADEWRAMYASASEAAQLRATGQRGAALQRYADAMRTAERCNVPEDLVAVAAPYLDALVEASQLDSARVVAGRIAPWAQRDLRAATAQARLYGALGLEDAARKAEEVVARLASGSATADPPR